MTTNEELAAIDADAAWWRNAGDQLGLSLNGFTFRHSALFIDPESKKSVELPGSVAARLNATRLRAGAGVRVTSRDIGEAVINASNMRDDTLGIDGNALTLVPSDGFVRIDLKALRRILSTLAPQQVNEGMVELRRPPSQTEMNQRFYVDVCRAEDLIKELASLARAVLNKQPAHWHDEDTVNLDDLVRDIEKNGATIATARFAGALTPRATNETEEG